MLETILVEFEEFLEGLMEEGMVTQELENKFLPPFREFLLEVLKKPNEVDDPKVSAILRPLFESKELIGSDNLVSVVKLFDEVTEAISAAQCAAWDAHVEGLKPKDFQLSKETFGILKVYGWKRCYEKEAGSVILCLERESTNWNHIMWFWWTGDGKVDCRVDSSTKETIDDDCFDYLEDEEYDLMAACAAELQDICRGIKRPLRT